MTTTDIIDGIPTDTIDKLAEVWASLSALGASLTETDWKTATALPSWSVQDNLSHIIGTERMLQGLTRTEHRATIGEHVKNPIGELNEHEVDSRRGTAGADVLAEWNELAALRLDTLRTADAAYFATETLMPTGSGTLADFLHIRVLDAWAHEQDMRSAVGRPGNQDSAAAAHSIDRLARTLGIVIGKRAKTPEGDAVTIELTGPIVRSWTHQIIDGRAALVSDAAPVATLRMSSSIFAALAFGRVAGSSVIDQVEIEGDAVLATRIVDSLNMMI
jgi:uncharacterized protein (TIGR03083 family)